MERETLRGLIERVTLVPDRTAEAGFVIELEGRLADMRKRPVTAALRLLG